MLIMIRLLSVIALFAAASAIAADPSVPASSDQASQAAETPEFAKLSKLLSYYKVERCGLCAVRADSRGISCRIPLRLEDNCRDNCGKEVLVVSAQTLKKRGFTAEAEGFVAAGAVKFEGTALIWAVEKAQRLKGVDRRKFSASAVATCR
jgi:hypothetical protein